MLYRYINVKVERGRQLKKSETLKNVIIYKYILNQGNLWELVSDDSDVRNVWKLISRNIWQQFLQPYTFWINPSGKNLHI